VYDRATPHQALSSAQIDPFEEIATAEVSLGGAKPWNGTTESYFLAKIAVEEAAEAFAEARQLDGCDEPVFVGGAVFDPVIESAINATSAIQRHTKTYATPADHAAKVEALQKTIDTLLKPRFGGGGLGSKYFKLAGAPEDEATLLKDLVLTAINTVAESPTWTSKFWQDTLTLENVDTMTIIPEYVRALVSKENKRNEDYDEDPAHHHADGPYTKLTLFLEVPGKRGTVTPLARCVMTKASMAAGGRLFHVMKRLNLNADALSEKFVSFNLNDAFYCEPQPARSEIGVSLVDMFDPIHRYSEEPTGSLVRISFRMRPGTPLDTCMPWIAALTTPSPNRDGEHKWDASTMHSWYAFSRRKMEEVATHYQGEAQLIYTSALPYDVERRAKLLRILERHEQMNKCLVAFGAEPRLLTGMDGPAGIAAAEEDPATRATRPANLPTGLENHALTQELILDRYAAQQPRRLGQDGCAVQDIAC
jgi:hypothetical protein